MKKTLLSLAALMVLAISLVSCNGGSPKGAAEKWLNGFYHMDYAAAKEVSTEETKKQLDAYEQMASMMQSNAKEAAKKIKVDVKEPKVTGDNATVEYTVSDDPTPKTLKMVKQNGKWLAQWSKMDMGGGAGAGTGADMNSNGGGTDMNAAPPAGPDTLTAPPADGAMNNGNGNGTTPAPAPAPEKH